MLLGLLGEKSRGGNIKSYGGHVGPSKEEKEIKYGSMHERWTLTEYGEWKNGMNDRVPTVALIR